MSRQGRAQATRALDGNAEAALPNPRAKSLRDSRGLQRLDRGMHSQKNASTRPGRRGPPQMLDQRGGNLVGQRQLQGRGSLALVDTQTTLPPAKVIEGDGHYFTDAQSVGSDQEKHRVIAQPHSRGSVYASQKILDRLPWKDAG